jgi:hypothetical protein
MQITPFRIEQYHARHEFTAADRLSSSDSRRAPSASRAHSRRTRRAGSSRLARLGYGRANMPEALERVDGYMR